MNYLGTSLTGSAGQPQFYHALNPIFVMAWALRLQGTCGPPLGSEFGLVRCHVNRLHGWEEYGLSEHGLVLMEFRGMCAKESKPFISFRPVSLPFGYEIWCFIESACCILVLLVSHFPCNTWLGTIGMHFGFG